MVKYARQRGMTVTTYSNGTLMNRGKALEICNSKLNGIGFSIEGIINYEKIRVGSNLKNVKKNLKDFMEIRKQAKSEISVGISTILQKENYKELKEIVELVHDVGIENYNIDFPSFREQYDKDQIEFIFENKEEINMEIDQAISLAKRYGIKVTRRTFERNNSTCSCAWYGVNISTTGNVSPCGISYNQVMGNLFSECFDNIWNNEIYRSFRREWKKGVPKECIKCVYFFKSI